MERRNWLWLGNTEVSDNIRVVIKIITKGAPDALEVCVNSRVKPVERWWQTPVGYSFMFAGDGGARDIILKNESKRSSDIIGTAKTRLTPNSTHILMLERKGDLLSMFVDGHESLRVKDMFPPRGLDLNRIGLRSHSLSSWIKSISVYRLALPEKASPLIAGDTLAELQHFEEAIAKYLTIAENYGASPVAERALTKAYITAATKLVGKKADILLDIKKEINEKFPKYRHSEIILEIDALIYWRQNKFDSAFELIAEAFEINPYTKIMLRILQCQHKPLPGKAAEELLLWTSRTKNLKRLNLANLGLNSIEHIKDMSLTFLDCSNNNISDLSPLKNMYLETLSCENNKIKNLAPLTGMRLVDLNCSSNKISGLEALEKMPLKILNCSGNKILSLDTLKLIPLERLECAKNLIQDIAPIKNLSLKYLNCSSNKIKTIEPLQNMPLETLICSNNEISDLAPLANSGIEVLNCANNKISDLSPLKGSVLMTLNCSRNNISSLESLQNVPLETLDCSFTPIRSIEPLLGMPLKSLDLQGCADLYDISSIAQFESLEQLKIPSHIKETDFLSNHSNLNNKPGTKK